jgi:integrase
MTQFFWSNPVAFWKGGTMFTNGELQKKPQHAVCDTIATYAVWLQAQGYDLDTIAGKVRLLNRLPAPLETVSADNVLALIGQATKNSSKRIYLNNLRLAFKDLKNLGLVDHDPTLGLRTPPTQRGKPRPIPVDELAVLLTMRERERAWTILGWRAGLRAVEVTRVEAEHLERGVHGWQLRIPRGKNDKDATIPAHPQVVDVLRHVHNDGPLWPFHSRYISRKWREMAEGVGVTGRRFHDLRHTFATNAYKASGNDLLVTKELCRHASVQSTQIYAGIEDERPFEVVAGL